MKIVTLVLVLSFSCCYDVYSNQLHAEKGNLPQHLTELVAAIHMPPQFTAKVIYTHRNATEEVLYLEGDIIVRGNKYRLTLEDQIVVSNGETLWNYIPSLQEVQICDDIAPDTAVNMETFSPIQLLQLYKHGFTPITWYTSTTAQAPCYIINFIPTKQQPNVKQLSLHIDAKTYQINNIQLIANDQAVHQFDIMHLTLMKNVKDEDFEFPIPTDCQEIIDLR